MLFDTNLFTLIELPPQAISGCNGLELAVRDYSVGRSRIAFRQSIRSDPPPQNPYWERPLAGITTRKKKIAAYDESWLRIYPILPVTVGKYSEPRRRADAAVVDAFLEDVAMSSLRLTACLDQNRRTRGPDRTLVHAVFDFRCN